MRNTLIFSILIASGSLFVFGCSSGNNEASNSTPAANETAAHSPAAQSSELEKVPAPSAASDQMAAGKEAEGSAKDGAAGSNASRCKNAEGSGYITGKGVRVRQTPEINNQNILFQLNTDEMVDIIGSKEVGGKTWFEICHKGKTGWVSGDFVDLIYAEGAD